MRCARMMAAPVAAAFAAVLVTMSGVPAFAASGAFAHDETTGKYGYSWNEQNEKKAEEAALKGCASDACKIVFRIGAGQCGAMAMNESGKVWGGARRPKREEAEKAALDNCQKRNNSAPCKVRGSECNK